MLISFDVVALSVERSGYKQRHVDTKRPSACRIQGSMYARDGFR